MGDEHLDTIPKKESDEFIKFSVENLVPNPSEFEDEGECDVPVCDDFTTFFNLLFDADDDFSSKKIIIDLKDELVSLLEKEKKNLKTIESLKSKDVETGVESSEKVVSETENKSENNCQVIEKVYDSEENPNVIAPGMFKLSVSQSVSLIFVTKTSCASNVDENTLSRVGRPKLSVVIWMRKGLSITVKAVLSSVNHFNLNKNVKRYSRKNLMACNNFDTRSTFDCNKARMLCVMLE
nr:hypothetical protein [Tanacetum cinerariifolium]